MCRGLSEWLTGMGGFQWLSIVWEAAGSKRKWQMNIQQNKHCGARLWPMDHLILGTGLAQTCVWSGNVPSVAGRACLQAEKSLNPDVEKTVNAFLQASGLKIYAVGLDKQTSFAIRLMHPVFWFK